MTINRLWALTLALAGGVAIGAALSVRQRTSACEASAAQARLAELGR
jgi:hypothetical protein